VKVGISGKGGTGKTTLSALLARIYARRGRRVIAIDADSNPNLASSLGIPAEVAASLRTLPSRAFDHDATVRALLAAHSVVGPDGVRMVLAARIERAGSG
jgi:CO dehydrogenase maturation factor